MKAEARLSGRSQKEEEVKPESAKRSCPWTGAQASRLQTSRQRRDCRIRLDCPGRKITSLLAAWQHYDCAFRDYWHQTQALRLYRFSLTSNHWASDCRVNHHNLKPVKTIQALNFYPQSPAEHIIFKHLSKSFQVYQSGQAYDSIDFPFCLLLLPAISIACRLFCLLPFAFCLLPYCLCSGNG